MNEKTGRNPEQNLRSLPVWIDWICLIISANSAFEKILPNKSKYELEDENIEEKKLHIFKWLNKIGATFQFKKEEEIRMFVEGVIDLVEKIKKSREEETSSEDSSFDESSKDN